MKNQTRALITSVCVESTGIWAFTERKSGSCTCKFTEATATPTRASEIERGFRNIAVRRIVLALPWSHSGPVSQRKSLGHVRLGGPRTLYDTCHDKEKFDNSGIRTHALSDWIWQSPTQPDSSALDRSAILPYS